MGKKRNSDPGDMRILKFITLTTSSIQAINFNSFWSNGANKNNMEQELTLAQCKSTFRIFQVGIPEPRSGKFSDWFGILESHVESDGRHRNGTKDNVSHHAIH